MVSIDRQSPLRCHFAWVRVLLAAVTVGGRAASGAGDDFDDAWWIP